MKKLILTTITVGSVLLGSTYLIGEIIQKELINQLAKSHSQQIKTELVSYQKSFLSANMKLKVTLSIEGSEPLQLLVDSDIHHYPFKATSTNHITISDSEQAKKIRAFFHEEDWNTSYAEVNLLGELTANMNLISGSFESKNERLLTKDVNFIYKLNVFDNNSQFNIDWVGFEGKTLEGEFSAKDINATYYLSHIPNTSLINYQYQADFKKIELSNAEKKLSMQGVSLEGNNEISENLLTVNTSNEWRVKEYSNGIQSFMDNHINLHLSDLNLNALTLKGRGINASDVSSQILNGLLNKGFKLDLQNLYSNTPWGKVDGKLKMDIQPGMTIEEVIDNPFLLIDYVNGNLALSLPQKLSQQAQLSDLLKIGAMSGILKPEGEQLTVKSTLDRGELKINERIIPM